MRWTVAVLALLTLLVPPLAVGAADGDGQRYDLRPRFQTGQKFAPSWRLKFQADKSVLGIHEMADRSAWVFEGSAAVEVIEAGAGAVGRMTVAFGECRRVQPALDIEVKRTEREQELFFSRNGVEVAARPDPFTGERKLAMTSKGRDVHSDVAKTVERLVLASIMPREPVPAGARWKVDDLEPLLGQGVKGSAELRLAKVERRGGRSLARIEAEGQVRQDPPDPVMKGLVEKDGTIEAKFTGTLDVDTDTGLVVAVDLKGPGTMKLTANTFEGTWSYVRQLGPLERHAMAGRGADTRPTVYLDRKGYFSVTVPPGWNPVAQDNGVFLHSREHQGLVVGDVVCSVQITVDPAAKVTGPEELKRYLRRGLEMARNQPVVTFEVQDEGPLRVGGQDGVACTYTEQTLDHRKRHLVAGTLVGQTPVVFTATVRDDLFDKVAPELRAIREGIAIHNPPKPPPADPEGEKRKLLRGKLADW